MLPLLGIPSLITGGLAQRLRQRVREETVEDKRLSEHLFTLGTTLGPGKELRSFGLAGEVAGRHGALRRAIQLRDRQAVVRATFATTLGWLAFAAGCVGVIVFVALLAIDGRATAGDVLLVIALSGQIQDELEGAVSLIGEFVPTLRAWPRVPVCSRQPTS